MLKIRTASTELTLGAFCCTQHSCKECRQIAFIGVTHNIYAKNLCYLSDKQLLLRLICLHSNVREAHHFPIWRQCQVQSATPAAAPVPSPRCMPAVRNGRLPSASSSKMLAGSSDLCAATIKCTDCGHNRTARSAAAHEITPSSTTGMRCAAAPRYRPHKPAISKPPTLCNTSIESFESGL